MGVNRLFERGASLFGDRVCLKDSSGTRTYAEVRYRRDRAANAMAARGIGHGTHIAVLSKNCGAALEAMLAIYRAGAVYVPLNTLNRVPENTAIARARRVQAVFYDTRVASDVAQLRAECPDISSWISLAPNDVGDPTLDELVTEGAPLDTYPDIGRDDLVSIYSTGGTTGTPKGVMFTSLTWEIMAANMMSSLPLQTLPTYLVVSPITHAAGTMGLLLLAAGATLVILDAFDAEKVLFAIEQERVTHLYLPPTAIYSLLSHERLRQTDLSSIQAFIYTSAPMAVEKLRQCLEIFGPVMLQYWGQTEAPIFCTALLPDDHYRDGAIASDDQLRSCGRAMLLTEVAIMDDDGALLPDGELGELVVRGNLVMAGYHENSDATADASRFGWHHTGDIGYRDADGYFYLMDRKGDMIISGGFNVYPSEIEQVILSHPAVRQCAVVGVPDEKWGEAVVGVVEADGPGDDLAEELRAMCKEKLGSIKTPKRFEFRQSLPLSTVGKVDKKTIRASFWQASDRKV